MKGNIKFVLIVFAGLFLCASTAFSQNRVKKLDDFFSAFAKNRDFNGNVLIAEKGRIIYEKSFGYADFPRRRLNTKNALFPFASISKTITATAILQQVEKGEMRLSDPVVKFLPAFPYPEITVRHLLSHTSGLPPYNAFFEALRKAEPKKVFTNDDFMAGLNADRKPLIYRSGESWNYDNTNFIVLALILEKVSGEKYEDYIEKHILEPAGMRETFFFQDLFDSSKNNIRNLVIPHWYPRLYSAAPVRADSIAYLVDYWKSYHFSGFGEYVGTARDLLKYDRALAAGTLVSEKALSEAFAPVKLNNGKENAGNYGLGWTILKDDSLGKTVFHAGGSIGLSCVLFRNIAKDQTVILFDLAHPGAPEIAAGALKILNNGNVPLPKKKIVRIYGKILTTEGKAAAAEALDKLRKDPAGYELDKEDLIKLGYELLGDVDPFHLKFAPQYDEALEVFRQCVRLFPAYWNSYDSYADALARTGNKKAAIEMYKKSLELKPDSESGIKALQKLLEEKND